MRALWGPQGLFPTAESKLFSLDSCEFNSLCWLPTCNTVGSFMEAGTTYVLFCVPGEMKVSVSVDHLHCMQKVLGSIPAVPATDSHVAGLGKSFLHIILWRATFNQSRQYRACYSTCASGLIQNKTVSYESKLQIFTFYACLSQY